jgi:integrase
MKAGTEHIAPVNDIAMSVLTRLHSESGGKGLIFANAKGAPLSDMTLTKLLRDAGLTVTAHGFRSTFRDWAAEQMIHIPDSVAEAALAHKVPDAVVKAYKRTNFLELRRELMAAWSNYLLGKPATANSDATQSEGTRMAG